MYIALIKSLLFIIFLILNAIQSHAYASMWPVISPPNVDFLLQHHYIDTSHCPAGQGQLRSDALINIRSSLCKTYCPDTWNWIGKSDGACHDLATDFTFLHYEIERPRDTDGTTLYSIVTAIYGDKNNNQHHTTFTFTTPKEHWYCYDEGNELHTVECGNDI